MRPRAPRRSPAKQLRDSEPEAPRLIPDGRPDAGKTRLRRGAPLLARKSAGFGIRTPDANSLISTPALALRIFQIRGLPVMIDRDLAELYRVRTKAINQAVKRNLGRFPEGFLFRLTRAETSELVTICDRFATLKHATATPLAFTDYGVAMLSSVLRSGRAIKVNIQIMQTFIRLRQIGSDQRALVDKIDALEKITSIHDMRIQLIFDALGESEPSGNPRPVIGFRP